MPSIGSADAPSVQQRAPWRPRDGLKTAIAKLLHASWQRCRVHFARNALAHAGKNGRRVVAAFIATGVPSPPKPGLGWATAFAQNDADAAKQQWRPRRA